MKKILRLKHSYNAGDLISILPGLQHLWEKNGQQTIIYQVLDFPAFYYEGAYHPTTNSQGQQVCMNESMWDRLMSLLIIQPYIAACKKWEGEEVDFDIDKTRHDKMIPMPAGHLHHYPWSIFPELSCDLSYPWLFVSKVDSITTDKGDYPAAETIIVNRTHRYTNPYINYYFLKQYKGKVVFSGTQKERDDFCRQFDLDLPLITTNNFFELAVFICSCKLYVGNQSFGWHLADAIKAPRILELCPQLPHVFPTGGGGHAFYHQKSLEYYVKKMTDETH